jgi:hypothetical protein
MLVNEKSNFTRGDKASVSVRLRSKSRTSEANQVKKKNRHSGDFSFFKHRDSNAGSNPDRAQDQTKDTGQDHGGDWAYITFENGVPNVQDIQTNVGPVGGGVAALATPNVQNGARPVARPVKVVTHQITSAAPQMPNRRISGDFSMFAPVNMQQQQQQQKQQAPPLSRQVTPAAMAFKQQQQPQKGRSPKRTTPQPKEHVTQVMVTPNHVLGPRPNVMYRRRSDQIPKVGVALHGGAAKRCSGEFDFARNNRRSGSDYSLFLDSEEKGAGQQQLGGGPPPPQIVRVQVNYNNNKMRPKSMAITGSSPDIVRGTPPIRNLNLGSITPISEQAPPPRARPTGLGRRAATQINIQQKKKNSYNSAMCKSQENLVKVGSNYIKSLFLSPPQLSCKRMLQLNVHFFCEAHASIFNFPRGAVIILLGLELSGIFSHYKI